MPSTGGWFYAVMLPRDLQWYWLLPADDPVNLEKVKELVRPFDESEMVNYPVPKLRGKNTVGNQKQAMEYYESGFEGGF